MARTRGKEIASPGHKLGQMVGAILQKTFRQALRELAEQYDLYCDTQGDRPGARKGRKVTWKDKQGNDHDLDYVFERGGAPSRRGEPVAFIEVAWRRGTRHSRNKAGEIQGALLPLRDSYSSVQFVGAILAGRFTEGGIHQLESSGIEVLYIPFDVIASAFLKEDVNIDYPDKASPTEKFQLQTALETVDDRKIDNIVDHIREAVKDHYDRFTQKFAESISVRPIRIRILTLQGFEQVFTSVRDAISSLSSPVSLPTLPLQEQGYEIFIELSSGSEIRGRFVNRQDAIAFLRQVADRYEG